MNVVHLEDPHFATQSLLPWYATGRLDAADVAQVETHLAGCPACRAELEFERKLLAAQPLPADAAAVEAGLDSMRKLIRTAAPASRRPAPWLRWALGAQFVVLALLLLVWALPRPATEAVYRALGAPSAAALPNAIVIFKPQATEQEIRSALRLGEARIVDGPTASNAYLLSVDREHPLAAIERLRLQPAVLLAESLDPRPPR
ncbi:hypothetical protein GCM10027034_06130 [Ramlibacter solisilvae]|uniref:Putative zinc-finger domain-containing protein n=1 Tax=Ramlibacter tataouinensis TaxID=94132 RepID=A0A127K1G2_9BURK|nr:zf-HC2 domain-containing protein [Ramlibacter tataouinensis]AMO24972.1 hypothetical protein UC35_21750 [Ramlibacter tataouinensis]